MLVSSPGGHLESGDAIHDIVRFIAAPVNRVGSGAPASDIARETGKSLEVVLANIERDHWLSAEEAVDYGLVSRIIERKTELKGA
jgi:ATP-dependent Clp protease, protease subunit